MTLVREDRGQSGQARSTLLERRRGQPHRSARRQCRLHAVPEPARRDRRRRDGHAARARIASASSPAQASVDGDLGWLRMRIRDGDDGRDPRRHRRARRDRTVGSAPHGSSCGASRGRRLERGAAVPNRTSDPTSTARPCSRSGSPMSASSAASSTSSRDGRYRCGTGSSAAGAGARHHARRATAFSTRCGWRRATGTSAPISRPTRPRTRRGSVSASRSTATATSWAGRVEAAREAGRRAPAAHVAGGRRAST